MHLPTEGPPLGAPGNPRPVHALCQVHGLSGSERIHDYKSKACHPSCVLRDRCHLKAGAPGAVSQGLALSARRVTGRPESARCVGATARLSHTQTQKEARARHINPFGKSSSFSGCHCTDRVRCRETRNVSPSIQCFTSITRREHFPREATSHGGELNAT